MPHDANSSHSTRPLDLAHVSSAEASPWCTVSEAARRARCGVKTIYREVRAGRLKAARLGGRRELRFRPEWVDAWLDRTSAVSMVHADGR